MKALSIHPYYAMAIIAGQKTVEIRSWETNYRGDILICSTAKKQRGTIPGHALGVVTLEDVRRFEKKDCKPALLDPKDYVYHCIDYAWILTNVRPIKPVPVKGKLSLWNYDGAIEFIPESEWLLPEGIEPGSEQDTGEFFEKYWKKLIY
ncbi:ASCH domain-containing protein [Butyrivibrio sp. INlla16]|uniref:ASCH domain-containing protein n=1 Tax=Butyrivibrio sp. INlla16 TaxID=1520807 RepID=UPI00088D084E|nr:ASCH domain-containing protein [Butyrivibrio sp. INlla16]SDB66652.1 ASCH domain-containing protein [Butyrivibrio sp. INlla16]